MSRSPDGRGYPWAAIENSGRGDAHSNDGGCPMDGGGLISGGGNPLGTDSLKEADPIDSGYPRGSRCLGVQAEEVILGVSDKEL